MVYDNVGYSSVIAIIMGIRGDYAKDRVSIIYM